MSVPTGVRSRTEEARELALRLIEDNPGVQQRDVIAQVQDDTGLAPSTVSRLLQGLERDGLLEGGRDGRRKTYAVAGQAAPGRQPETEPEPHALDTSPGTRGELVAVVTALFIAASLVAFVLAPDKGDDSERGSLAPVTASEEPPAPREPADEPAEPREPRSEPASKPKPKKRREPNAAALTAAKRTEVAVLSGSAVPGIAARTGEQLERKGFRVGMVTNAPGPSPGSVVLYARGKKSAAGALARSLKIRSVKAADPNAQALAPQAGLLVVVGADRRR